MAAEPWEQLPTAALPHLNLDLLPTSTYADARQHLNDYADD